MNRTVYRYSRLLHKWAGLILAIQLLCWILGGVVMSAIPLDKVHGKHLASRQLENNFLPKDYVYSLDKIVDLISEKILTVKFDQLLDKPIYLINTSGSLLAFDATSGFPVAPVNETQIKQLALQHYLGKSTISKVALLNETPQEATQSNDAVWQVIFDDTWTTTLYFDPKSAQLITVRSDIWRIFDFFWMLHIMDYDERKDINNLLLIIFASCALVFAFSGIVLLFQSFRFKRKKRVTAS